MGQFLGVAQGQTLKGVRPEIVDIVKNAIAAIPYDAMITSGERPKGKTALGNHDNGYAIDVQLYDHGKPLPNKGTTAYAAYETYAQAARVYQQQTYPSLNLRTGLGFATVSGGKTLDPMHLDITPGRGMPLYDWNTGGKGAYAQFSNGGLGGTEGARRVSQIQQSLLGGPTPPADVPGAPNSSGSPDERSAFAASGQEMPMPGRPAAVDANPQANLIPPEMVAAIAASRPAALNAPPAPVTAPVMAPAPALPTAPVVAPQLQAPVPMPGRPALQAAAPATVAPQPMPGRPAALAGAPAAPAAASAVPATPAPQMVRLQSGKMISPGVYPASDGQHHVQISDDGSGNAVVTKIQNPGEIPGVMDPLHESKGTIVGGVVGQKIGQIKDQVANTVAPAIDQVKQTASQAAASLSNAALALPGQAGGAFAALGNFLTGGATAAPTIAPPMNSSGSPDDRGQPASPAPAASPDIGNQLKGLLGGLFGDKPAATTAPPMNISGSPDDRGAAEVTNLGVVPHLASGSNPASNPTPTPDFTVQQRTITNPAYTDWLAQHKADDVGTAPSFGDLQAAVGTTQQYNWAGQPIKPVVKPVTVAPVKAPPTTITVPYRVAVPQVAPQAAVVAPPRPVVAAPVGASYLQSQGVNTSGMSAGQVSNALRDALASSSRQSGSGPGSQ